jgi:hypothetical protein
VKAAAEGWNGPRSIRMIDMAAFQAMGELWFRERVFDQLLWAGSAGE